MDFNAVLKTDYWHPEIARTLAKKLAPYPYAFDIVVVILAFAIGALIAWMMRKLLVRLTAALYARSATVDDEVRGEIVRLATGVVWMLPVYGVCFCSYADGMHVWLVNALARLCLAVLSILAAFVLKHAVNLVGIWYRRKLGSENRPIDGLIAVVRAFIVTAGLVCAVSLLIGKSPLYLLSALGAAAAVLMIVFQDSLLSFAATMQVNSNRLVNIGDWIVQKDKGVDGVVEALTLHTVKVRNWDETVVALPVRALVDESFVNMTRMQESGGRRFKREFLIDQRSVRFLRQSELDELRRFDLLLDAEAGGKGRGVADVKPHGPAITTGARHQTNLGAFRAYLNNYLARHPFIRQDKLLVVTALEPTSQGVPLQVYAFSTKTDYKGFSEVAADITEHVLAVLPSFHLRMFQDCSDIYQVVGDTSENVDGIFTYETYSQPQS